MSSLILAGYSLATILSFSGGAVFGESYMQQTPSTGTNPAFIEQLPETAVMGAPERPTQRRGNQQRPKHLVRDRAQEPLVTSIFPNVGSGVTERAAPAPADNQLPTVGRGTVGR